MEDRKMKKILNCTSLLIAFTTFVSIVSCQKEMAPNFTPEEPSAKEHTLTVGSTITTNTANFTSQQAIVKFRLTDGVSPVAVNSLTISANSGKLVTNKSYRGLEPKTYYYGNGYYTVDAGSGGYNDDEVHN